MKNIILAILLFSSFFINNDANASCNRAPTNRAYSSATCSTEGEAVQYVSSRLQAEITNIYINPPDNPPIQCRGQIIKVSTTSYKSEMVLCSDSSFQNQFTATFTAANTCAKSSTLSGTGDFNAANDGDIRCFGGCKQTLTEGASSWIFSPTGATCSTETFPLSCGTGYSYNITFSICEKLPPDTDGDGVPDSEDEWPFDPTRTHDTDGDGIADEFDAFPNDPLDNADSDSDGVGDNNDIAPNDPTNGSDNGDGNETDNLSSGGALCTSPPVSHGDAIASQIAYQTWKTRCQAERLVELEEQAATTKGQQHAEAIAKLNELKAAIVAQGVNGGTGTDLDVSSMSFDDGVSGVTGGMGNPEQITLDTLDTTGFLGGSTTCPQMPEISVMGVSFDYSTIPHVCEFFQIGASLVLLFGALSAFRIISGGNV